jgi:hypothetical protein
MLGFMPLSAAPMSSLGLAIVMAGSAGAYAATGQAATWDRTVAHNAGAYALTGQDAELDPSLFFRCQTGDFVTTGQPARFRRSVVSPAGTYATTGQSANLLLGQVLEADAGAYSTTGQSVIFRIGGSVIGEVGSYLLTGQPARARYVLTADRAQLGSASPQWPISSQPMASLGPAQPSAIGYLVQGQAASLRGTMAAGAGAYLLTGYPVRFIKGPVIRARGRDLSGPLVAVRDLSGSYVRVRDTSEGLP